MATTDPRMREALIENVVSAHRVDSPRGGIEESSAFFDLDEAAREEAFEATVHARALEAALNPEGQSTTVRAVLQMIERASH